MVMLRYRAAAPWTVYVGNTGPFSVVMGSLPRAMCRELVAVTSLCSKVHHCSGAGQWSGRWVWFSISGPAGRWLVVNRGTYSRTADKALSSPAHFKLEQRLTPRWRRVRAGHQVDERGHCQETLLATSMARV